MPSDIVITSNDLELKANSIHLTNIDNKKIGSLTPIDGNLTLGGNGADGDVLLKDSDGNIRIHISSGVDPNVNSKVRFLLDTGKAAMFLGRNGVDGNFNLLNKQGSPTIQLNASSGDIILETIGSLVKKIQDLEKRIQDLES